MTRKTYGVKDLMEWKVFIPVKSKQISRLEIDFTGGGITGYGVSPARYTTTDRCIQNEIEKSQWFKRRKIFLIKEEEIPLEKESAL